MNTTAKNTRGFRDTLADWVLAIGLTLFGWGQLAMVPFFLAGMGPGGGPGGERIPPPFVSQPVSAPTWIAFALVALATVPLAWRRRHPIAVLATTVVFAGAYDLLGHPPVMIAFAPLIALYTVGTLRDRRTLLYAALVVIVVALAVELPSQPSTRFFAEAIRITAMYAFAAALGDAARTRRAYVAEVEQRAIDAERTRDEVARHRVEEERLRIARELHDVTAHSLSIIAVQAGAAEKVLDRDPAAARRALGTIRATSSSSLDELRAILGVLRGTDDGVPLAPAGSIDRLAELAATVEDAGVQVELHVADLGEVPAFVEVSAYRIVQEALTNVVRHAKATSARVELARRPDALSIEITDDGAADSSHLTEGHGIPGMRERVVALGGRFEAGPRQPRGFRVAAAIPIKGGAA